MKPIHIKLYTKPACCLCDKALQVLKNLETEFAIHVELVDVSRSRDLLRRYGNGIPVATCGGRELFRYQANEDTLRIALQEWVQGRAGTGGESAQPTVASRHFENS